MSKLKENHEVVGRLISIIEENDGHAGLIFSTMKKIEIPTSKTKHMKLKEQVGKRIGLIHLDGEYKIRRISK